MKIRQLLPSDKDGLLILLDQSYEEVKKDPSLGESLRLKRPDKEGQSKWFEDANKLIKDGDAVFYVAEDQNKIVGYCAIVKKDIPDSEMSHIGVLGMRVEDGRRGQGIGSQLIKESLNACKGKFEVIELFVFKPNEAAQRLYRKFGFKEWGLAPRSIKRGKNYIDGMYMSLQL